MWSGWDGYRAGGGSAAAGEVPRAMRAKAAERGVQSPRAGGRAGERAAGWPDGPTGV